MTNEHASERHAGLIAEALENVRRLPEHLRGGMQRYLEHGIEPGRFLCACIENNLQEAVSRCTEHLETLRFVTLYLYNFAPSDAWGSKEKRIAWQERVKARSASEVEP